MLDISTKDWSVLKSDVKGDKPWRCRNGVYDPRISKWVYGDSINSNIGILDDSSPDQYGEQVEGIFYTQIIPMENVSIGKISMQHLPGRGPSGINPTCLFSISFDGLTYGKEYTIPMGRRADYQRRFEIDRVGYIRNYFSLKFRLVNSAPTAFSSLKLDYS